MNWLRRLVYVWNRPRMYDCDEYRVEVGNNVNNIRYTDKVDGSVYRVLSVPQFYQNPYNAVSGNATVMDTQNVYYDAKSSLELGKTSLSSVITSYEKRREILLNVARALDPEGILYDCYDGDGKKIFPIVRRGHGY